MFPFIFLVFATFGSYANLSLAASDTFCASTLALEGEGSNIEDLQAEMGVIGFSYSRVQSLLIGFESLKRLTHQDDVLIFLGNSPLWIAEVVEFVCPNLRTLKIPFSVGHYGRKSIDISVPQRNAFIQTLLNEGVIEELRKTKGRIVIGDYVRSGYSLALFTELISNAMPDLGIFGRRLMIVNFTYPTGLEVTNKLISNFQTIATQERYDVLLNHSDVHWMAETPETQSLGVSFPPEKWAHGAYPKSTISAQAKRMRVFLKKILEELKELMLL